MNFELFLKISNPAKKNHLETYRSFLKKFDQLWSVALVSGVGGAGAARCQRLSGTFFGLFGLSLWSRRKWPRKNKRLRKRKNKPTGRKSPSTVAVRDRALRKRPNEKAQWAHRQSNRRRGHYKANFFRENVFKPEHFKLT